jgi:hypothetical protein
MIRKIYMTWKIRMECERRKWKEGMNRVGEKIGTMGWG